MKSWTSDGTKSERAYGAVQNLSTELVQKHFDSVGPHAGGVIGQKVHFLRQHSHPSILNWSFEVFEPKIWWSWLLLLEIFVLTFFTNGADEYLLLSGMQWDI